MSRAYWNNTNETITYKVWTIDVDSTVYGNIKFLTSIGIKATLMQDDPKVIDWQGKSYRYAGRPSRVEFETTCEKQETMLKLLYGDKLLLMNVNVVTPYSICHTPI